MHNVPPGRIQRRGSHPSPWPTAATAPAADRHARTAARAAGHPVRLQPVLRGRFGRPGRYAGRGEQKPHERLRLSRARWHRHGDPRPRPRPRHPGLRARHATWHQPPSAGSSASRSPGQICRWHKAQMPPVLDTRAPLTSTGRRPRAKSATDVSLLALSGRHGHGWPGPWWHRRTAALHGQLPALPLALLTRSLTVAVADALPVPHHRGGDPAPQVTAWHTCHHFPLPAHTAPVPSRLYNRPHRPGCRAPRHAPDGHASAGAARPPVPGYALPRRCRPVSAGSAVASSVTVPGRVGDQAGSHEIAL